MHELSINSLALAPSLANNSIKSRFLGVPLNGLDAGMEWHKYANDANVSTGFDTLIPYKEGMIEAVGLWGSLFNADQAIKWKNNAVTLMDWNLSQRDAPDYFRILACDYLRHECGLKRTMVEKAGILLERSPERIDKPWGGAEHAAWTGEQLVQLAQGVDSYNISQLRTVKTNEMRMPGHFEAKAEAWLHWVATDKTANPDWDLSRFGDWVANRQPTSNQKLEALVWAVDLASASWDNNAIRTSNVASPASLLAASYAKFGRAPIPKAEGYVGFNLETPVDKILLGLQAIGSDIVQRCYTSPSLATWDQASMDALVLSQSKNIPLLEEWERADKKLTKGRQDIELF